MELVLWLFSIIIFWGYATWFITTRGVPKSWSDTFYTLDDEKSGRGYIFTGVLWGMLFPLLPLTVAEHPLMFPGLAAIAFVGAAPAFKNSKLEETVHVISAILAVLVVTLAIGLSYNLWYIATLLGLFILGLEFKWKPKNKTMWIESIVIAVGQLVILFKDVL